MIRRARIELFRIARGDKTWYFTSAKKAYTDTLTGITYYPIPGLSRTSITDESIDKCDVDITFPYPYPLENAQKDDLTKIYDRKIFHGITLVTVIEIHNNEPLVLFKGRLIGYPKFNHAEHTMTFECKTGESYFERDMVTPVFQSPCPHKVYDKLCALNFEDWAFNATVTAINGLDVTFEVNPTQVKDENGELVFEQIPLLDENDEPVLDEDDQPIFVDGDPVMEVKTIPENYLQYGLLRASGVFASTTNHSGNTVHLYAYIDLKIGDVIYVAPGCDQTLKMCYERFKNNFRHGGCPNIPQENPIHSAIMK